MIRINYFKMSKLYIVSYFFALKSWFIFFHLVVNAYCSSFISVLNAVKYFISAKKTFFFLLNMKYFIGFKYVIRENKVTLNNTISNF